MGYAIRDWDAHFETADTRKLKRLGWLKLPVKLDGWAYAQIIDHKDGPAHFGCWVALLELAATCKPRGTLNRPTGESMTLHDICRQTRIQMAVMEAAITRMAAIGWVESPENLPIPPDVPGDCRGIFRPRVEESRGDESLSSAGADKERIARFVAGWNNALRSGEGYHIRSIPKPPGTDSPRGKKLLQLLDYAASVCPSGTPVGRLLGLSVQRAFALPFHAERQGRGEEALGLDWFVRPSHREEHIELGLLALSNGSPA